MSQHHNALIYTMVIVSAADREMTDAELRRMGQLVTILPVFRDFPVDDLPAVARDCAALLDDEDGLEKTLGLIAEGTPAKLRETVYAVGCDIAAADGKVEEEEAYILQMLRHALGVDRLAAAAIERAARARHTTL